MTHDAGSVMTTWRDIWRGDLASVGAAADDGMRRFDELVARYREPHRRFHTLEHVTQVVSALLALPRDADGAAVRLAAWFHDAVYDPTRSDNESRSADLADEELTALGVGATTRERARALILTTRTHDPDPADEGAVALCRADLGILASSKQRYRRYSDQVRAEYLHLDDAAWSAGRVAFLRSMLGSAMVIPGDRAADRVARGNLAAELDALTRQPAP